ncbi:hypothetical protein BGZ65_000092, partial [Modicella reniformis]
VLKNVGKIERFVVEQLRKFITEDLVYPSYHSIELVREATPILSAQLGARSVSPSNPTSAVAHHTSNSANVRDSPASRSVGGGYASSALRARAHADLA